LHRPETLFSPGFQMSFAATAALVAVFNGLRDANGCAPARLAEMGLRAGPVLGRRGAGHGALRGGAFQPDRRFGLIANLLTVPLMGSLIIPAAVVAALLWPLGLSGLAFAVMEPALAWTLEVAARVAAMPGAVSHVPSPPGHAGPDRHRRADRDPLAGQGPLGRAAPTGAGGAALERVARPDVLISDTGRLAGVLTEEGRALSRARGDGFVAGVWLENDGDGAAQEDAARAEAGARAARA
jgi:competence protein ComEC